jgi:hypothetical protein
VILVLACRHEVAEGAVGDIRDLDGYRIIFTVGEQTINTEDLLTGMARCVECGTDARIVGVR